MWRSVGVEKLAQWRGKVGRSGEGRARGTVSIRILVRWLLSTCCSGITHDLPLGTRSPAGVVGVWRGLPELLTL